MSTDQSDRLTISPEEAARHLGLQPSTLANLRWKGGGPPFTKFGNRVRYFFDDIEEWARSRRRTSTSAPSGDQGSTDG